MTGCITTTLQNVVMDAPGYCVDTSLFMISEISAQLGQSFWMPTQASTFARYVDYVFYFILGIVSFFFILITVLMVVFAIRYRRRTGMNSLPSVSHNLKLELAWTLIPTLLVVIIFLLGFKGFIDITTPPANVYPITVIAQKWSWAFQYPNGYVDSQLHVPVNRPIQLTLTSRDVIHSFFVPAFRLKRDVVPGRYHRAWFEATEINDVDGFDILCSEYCGTGHSQMRSKVFVHDPTAFARWLDTAARWETRMSPVQRGQEIYEQRGCKQCHSIDGTKNTGPTFKNAWDDIVEGKTTFADGKKLSSFLGPKFTPEDYVRESVYQPQAKIVAGFTPAMPSFEGQLRDNDIPAIVAFLQSLSDKYKSQSQMAISNKPAASQVASTQSEPAQPALTQPAPIHPTSQGDKK